MTVPPPAVAALSELPPRVDSPYVFHSGSGPPTQQGIAVVHLEAAQAAWVEGGGRPLDLYGLRHACATLLLERGVTPADVAVQLGHSDGGRLVQVLYGHPSEDRARERLKLAFGGAASPRVRARRSEQSATVGAGRRLVS